MMKNLFIALTMVSLGLALSTSVNAADLGEVEIHGFASQGFIQTIDQDSFITEKSGQGSFNYNEFGANISKQLLPNMRMGLQLFSQDRGNYGNNKITLDYAYGDYRFADTLGFRAGKIKNPIGLYNETRDTDSLRTAILLPQGIYADAQREQAIALAGGGVYGTVPLGPVGTAAYQVQVGVLPMETDGGTAQQLKYNMNQSSGTKVAGANTVTITGTDTAKVTDAGSGTTFLHHLEYRPPVEGLRFTVTGIHTRTHFEVEDTAKMATTVTATGAPVGTVAYVPRANSITNSGLHKYVFSTEYTLNDLVLAAEYMMQDFDANSTVTIHPANSATPQVTRKTTPVKRDSWYVGATYRINDYLELGSYYNEFYSDRDSRSSDYQKDTAFSVRIDPVKNLVLKIEGHYVKGNALAMTPFSKDDWYIFASKVTYSF